MFHCMPPTLLWLRLGCKSENSDTVGAVWDSSWFTSWVMYALLDFFLSNPLNPYRLSTVAMLQWFVFVWTCYKVSLPLCITLSSSPVPSISWRRMDGIPFSRKVDVRKASGVLEIPYFQQEDAGTYECVAENSRGRNTVKGKLSFYGRWSWTTWVFEPVKAACVSFAQIETHQRET